jgi:hypothetical protein
LNVGNFVNTSGTFVTSTITNDARGSNRVITSWMMFWYEMVLRRMQVEDGGGMSDIWKLWDFVCFL